MKTIHDTVGIGGVALKNRIIRSATFERPMDPEGRFASTLIPIYEALAAGGVGAIITGMVGVDENSRVAPSMILACQGTFVSELGKVADRVHALGCKLVVQLVHCGQKASPDNGGRPLGPSENEIRPGETARAMSWENISAVVAAYAEAARRCKEAGADAVQMHCAHGYLVSQFLSPYFNKRTDEFGGDIAGRAHVAFLVYEAIRQAVGGDFSIWAKINCTDLTEPSLTPEESRWVCKELATRGLDAVELSGGVSVNAKSSSAQVIKDESEEGCFTREALALAEAVAIPVISVCGYRTPTVIEDRLNQGNIAAISMSRPLICEPGLVNRWADGDAAKARCISCNKCFRPKNGFGCQAFHN